MRGRRPGFTLVELLIVFAILAILAMIVIPQWSKASADARESALGTDLQTVRKQIDLYCQQHAGRSPDLDEQGKSNTVNFTARLMGRTDALGKLGGGNLGPYLIEWPANGFADSAVGERVKFGVKSAPPRDGSTGWYYSTSSRVFSANSKEGGVSFDPTADSPSRVAPGDAETATAVTLGG